MTLQMAPLHRTGRQDRRAPTPMVHCPHRGVDEWLGDRVISAHHTSAGVVRYLRCPCGALVTWLPDQAPRHSSPTSRPDVERPDTGRTRGGDDAAGVETAGRDLGELLGLGRVGTDS